MNMSMRYGEQLPDKYLYLMFAVFFSIFIPFVLASRVIMSTLGLDPETDFLSSLRICAIFLYLIMFFPFSILLEFSFSHWKKRKFRMGEFLVFCGLFMEAMLVTLAVLFAFEFAFPRLPFSKDSYGLAFLALALMIVLPLLVLAVTARIPRIREYGKKAIE